MSYGSELQDRLGHLEQRDDRAADHRRRGGGPAHHRGAEHHRGGQSTTTEEPAVLAATASAPPRRRAPHHLAAHHLRPADHLRRSERPGDLGPARQCESGGNWAANSGNGYYGGLQFSLATWQNVGGSGYPHQASKAEQIKRGKILQASAGWGQWPSCARQLGLL